MKQITIVLFFSSLFFFSCTNEQKETAAKPGDISAIAEIKFNSADVDLGAIAGKKTTYNFTFHNTGNGPLLISSAGSSCHCVQAKWPQQPVSPGDSAAIEVALDLSDVQQRFIRTLTVESNAKEPVVVLRITGEMKPGVN